MRGYISVDRSDQGQVPVDSRTEIYRDPGDSESILAEWDGKTVPLGISDVTVSRKKGEQAPLVIAPRSEFIEIHNNGNSNGVTVVSEGDERDVGEGRVETVRRDAEITIGYQTELQLTIEREAKVEQNVVNKGRGDVVMGDSIDNSTSMGDDNVINRSDIGGPDGAEVGSDNVVNRSEIGGTEPERTQADGTGADSKSTTGAETQFCIGCGSEIATHVQYCPSCGKELETNDPAANEGSATDTQQFCERHQRTYTGERCPDCLEHRSPQ
jgi:hypothetical protein